MDSKQQKKDENGISRRGFIGSVAAASAGLAVSRASYGQAPGEAINVALVGGGSQGRVLLMGCHGINKDKTSPYNVRFKAVCDVWSYGLRYAGGIMKKLKHTPNKYEDYREMLEKEKDLDAVLIATPDWKHAEITNACLKAGLHVYCEKEMSNTIEGSRSMVETAKSTGKLLQIGHQRRSNPRYMHANKLIHDRSILGRITHTYGQWNRSVSPDLGWPKKYTMDEATLNKWGYETMAQFRNWRWYKKYAAGPIADLGSHQVDIFSWFLKANPTAVMATGGTDYYKNREWYDNVMAFYEYQTAKGPVRAFYQVLNTTSFGGFYEVFMGDAGTLKISENTRIGSFVREVVAPPKKWIDDSEKIKTMDGNAIVLKVGETRNAKGEKTAQALKMEKDAQKPEHQPHLENFFQTIRGKAKLNCPAEIAYETALPILTTNKAVAEGRRIEIPAADYKV